MLVACDKTFLAIVGWREAADDGREGIRAVMHVVANRVKAWEQSWINVIIKPEQFSSMTILGDRQTVRFPTELELVNLWGLVDSIYNGVDSDNTNGALYYANEAIETSAWYKQNIIESLEHAVVAIIGRQTFRK